MLKQIQLDTLYYEQNIENIFLKQIDNNTSYIEFNIIIKFKKNTNIDIIYKIEFNINNINNNIINGGSIFRRKGHSGCGLEFQTINIYIHTYNKCSQNLFNLSIISL